MEPLIFGKNTQKTEIDKHHVALMVYDDPTSQNILNLAEYKTSILGSHAKENYNTLGF